MAAAMDHTFLSALVLLLLVLDPLGSLPIFIAVMRNVAALGFDAVLLSPRCADPLYRRSIKVAMGAVFTLPWARIDDWYGLPNLLADHGFTSYAMTLAEDSIALDAVEPAEKVAVIVGSEGPGLSEHWQREANYRIKIPMAAGIDSLNVAASTAIACWWFRPNQS